MKFNFKKISAIATSLLMTGMTVGSAFAAGLTLNDVGGQGNYAIVLGTNGADPSDSIQADKVGTHLKNLIGDKTSTGSVTLSGEGDKFKIESKNKKFNFLNGVEDIYSSLNSEKMPKLLKDLVYEDDEYNEFTVVQKIGLSNLSLDILNKGATYKNQNYEFGIDLKKNKQIMEYSYTFQTEPLLSNMNGTDLEILGRSYYVKGVDSTGITLLDTATTTVLEEGKTETVNVGGVEYSVSVRVYGDSPSSAILTVNGDASGKLVEGKTKKLKGGLYLIVKSISYSQKDSVPSEVEFSIGKGEIFLPKSGAEVEVNSERVDGLKSTISSTTSLKSITLNWTAEEDTPISADKGTKKLTFPVFEGVELVYGGMEIPSDFSEFEIVPSEEYLSYRAETKFGNLDIPVLYNSTATKFHSGEDSDRLMVVGVKNVSKVVNYEFNVSNSVKNYFIASYIEPDESYTYAYEASVKKDSSDNCELHLRGLAGDEPEIVLKAGQDGAERGDLIFTVPTDGCDFGASTAELAIQSQNSKGEVYSDRIVSNSGLIVGLPYELSGDTKTQINSNGVAVTDSTNGPFIDVYEQDVDGKFVVTKESAKLLVKADGDGIYIDRVSEGHFGNTRYELSKDNFVYYLESELATQMEIDTSGDLNDFVIKYSGEETYGNLYVVQAGVAIESGSSSERGLMVFKDNETTSYARKNLIIVGGSCVNAAAAKALGVPSDRGVPQCYTDTGVKTGEFLLKKLSIDGGNYAIIVAGHEKGETEMAVQKLLAEGVVEGVFPLVPSETA